VIRSLRKEAMSRDEDCRKKEYTVRSRCWGSELPNKNSGIPNSLLQKNSPGERSNIASLSRAEKIISEYHSHTYRK